MIFIRIEEINTTNDMWKCSKGKYLLTKYYGNGWICGDKKRIYINPIYLSDLTNICISAPFGSLTPVVTVKEQEYAGKEAQILVQNIVKVKIYFDFKDEKVHMVGIKALPNNVKSSFAEGINTLNNELNTI